MRISNTVLNKPLLREDLRLASNFKHTGAIEAVNNMVSKHAPKNTYFKQKAMLAKVSMTILDWNENSERNIKINPEGLPHMSIKYQRHGPKRVWVVKEKRQKNGSLQLKKMVSRRTSWV